MTNFDEFKKAAAETAGTVADKSIVFARKVADKTKCVARIAVLRAEIASEKDLLRNDFKELGKAYYNHHKDDPEPALAQLYTDVSVAAERIAAKRKEIEQLKDKVSELNFNQRKLQKVIDKIPPDVMEQMKKDERARRRAEREER